MRLMTGYRRPKNLRDYLCRAKTDYHPEKDGDTPDPIYRPNVCTIENCEICPKIDKSGKIAINGHETKNTKYNINCQSSNIVYCIECKCCNKRYIGETKRTLHERIKEHIADIAHRRYEKSEVAYHFNRPGHKRKEDVKVYILEFVYEHPASKIANKIRKNLEWDWVQRLKTIIPLGMNIMEARFG